MNTVTELLQPVENDLDDLILELKNLIRSWSPNSSSRSRTPF